MRVLEEGTSWANRAELYISLLKKATRQDMHISNNYYLDCCGNIHNANPPPLFLKNEILPMKEHLAIKTILLIRVILGGINGFITVPLLFILKPKSTLVVF